MKFPRNARIFRGQLDFTPFASVFFLLVIFMMLGSLVHTPGVRIQLPVADDLPGTDKPTVTVAMDASGRLYFQNQLIAEERLKTRLREVVEKAGQPLVLEIHADKAVTEERLIRLALLGREAGIHEAILATLPRLIAAPNSKSSTQR